MGMKILTIIGYIFLGFAVAGFTWLWVSSLITYACNAWWSARERYRKHMDDKVSELFENHEVH
jgi:hypothetical protein